MRPAGKARRAIIPGVFERGATQPDGMQRRPNAAGVSPRAARGDRSEHELQFVVVDLAPYALSAAGLCADYTPARDCRALAVHELVPRDLRDRAVARAGVHLPADDAYL